MAHKRRRFGAANGGNVAMLVAATMAPATIAALGGVDLFRATSAKIQLQDALDAASLGAARVNTMDPAVIQAEGMRLFNNNLPTGPRDFEMVSTTFTLMPDGRVVGQADATIDPLVAGLMDGEDMAVGASSEVRRANAKLEIVLVLDNTGSMDGSKLSNLKTAATNFINTMEQAQLRSVDPAAVKIAIIPFSQTVRVGSTYRYSSWIDQDGSSPINNEIFTKSSGTYAANRFTLLETIGINWAGCVESRKAPYDIQDTEPTTGATLFTPYFAPDEPDASFDDDYSNNYVSDNSSSSNFKVRQGRIDKYVQIGGLSLQKGPNRGCTMQPIQRLSQNWSSLRATVSAMSATGTTNIPMGLVWGWHALAPKAPFNDGLAYNAAKLKKIVVLMTDGDNTISDRTDTGNRSDYSGVGYVWQGRVLKANGTPLAGTDSQATRTAALDSRLALLCQAMKAPNVNIEIYAIRVEVVGGSSTVLSNCATDINHYFDVQSASQLNSVFQSVAGQIANLHLSR